MSRWMSRGAAVAAGTLLTATVPAYGVVHTAPDVAPRIAGAPTASVTEAKATSQDSAW